MRSPWSDEEVELLGELRSRGLTWGQVALRLGGTRSPGACSRAWHRHFVDPPPTIHYHAWTPQDDIEAMRMIDSGAHADELAERFGTTRQAIWWRNSQMWCRDMAPRKGTWDTGRSGEPWTTGDERRLREMVVDGLPWSGCAKELRRTERAVQNHGLKMGLRITGRTRRHRHGESGDRLPDS